MKFCRNLQRIIDIADPEWAPYWTNYKILKGEPVNLIQDVESAYKNSQDVIEDDEMTQPITVTKDQDEETSVKEFVEDEDDMNKYIDDNFVTTE